MSEPTRDGGAVVGAGELLQLLRDGVPRTRAELAEATGLARSTIGIRLDALLGLGLVGGVGDAVSTGGRPATRIVLRPGARVVLAADLGASHATAALTDLAGTVLASESEPLPIAAGPDAVLGWMVDAHRRMLRSLRRPASDLIGVGIGLPGPVEHDTGRPVNPPIMPGWHGVDVPGLVRRHLDVPVLVDNDVNIMALGEHALAPAVDDLVFVKVATGIGAGIISHGALQRGAQGVAGDLGHVRVPRGLAEEVLCTCGNRGCLEALAAGPAIARALRERGRPEVLDGADVIELVRRGDVDAIQAVRQAGRDIGEVLATLISIVNPAAITLGGSMAQVGDQLLAGIREVVYERSMPLATEHLSVTTSRAGEDAAVLGAAILALTAVLAPAAIDELLRAAPRSPETAGFQPGNPAISGRRAR